MLAIAPRAFESGSPHKRHAGIQPRDLHNGVVDRQADAQTFSAGAQLNCDSLRAAADEQCTLRSDRCLQEACEVEAATL